MPPPTSLVYIAQPSPALQNVPFTVLALLGLVLLYTLFVLLYASLSPLAPSQPPPPPLPLQQQHSTVPDLTPCCVHPVNFL